MIEEAHGGHGFFFAVAAAPRDPKSNMRFLRGREALHRREKRWPRWPGVGSTRGAGSEKRLIFGSG